MCMMSVANPFTKIKLEAMRNKSPIASGTPVAGPRRLTCGSACLPQTHSHTQFYTRAVISQPTPDDQLFGGFVPASLWFRDHITAS